MAPLEEILRHHPVWRGGTLAGALPVMPSGFEELDAELPGGGWPCGGLIEILARREGIGELALLLPVLSRMTAAGQRVLWLSPRHVPYAPALAAAGLDLANLALIGARTAQDALWTAEQALRAASCHALLAWLRQARYAELRRLAVAAESSRALLVLFRPAEAASESSPACLRLCLAPARDALEITILKRRAAPAAAPLLLHLERPVHALGRTSFPRSAERNSRADRGVGVPVHA
jgi:hypothetical protein